MILKSLSISIFCFLPDKTSVPEDRRSPEIYPLYLSAVARRANS